MCDVDVVMCLVRQVILEGPRESKDEAMAEVRACMENPFDNFALKPLLGTCGPGFTNGLGLT